jgi:hypothetical protein
MADKQSFIELINGREHEYLLQGILLYFLQKDNYFLLPFCDWFNIILEEKNPPVYEESKDGENRYDIQIGDGPTSKNIELKLWADFTPNQIKNIETIHGILLPHQRMNDPIINELKAKGAKIKTWEDFIEKFLKPNYPVAYEIFYGLCDYWNLGEFASREDIAKEAKNWLEGKSSVKHPGTALLSSITSGAKWVANASPKGHFWGRYLHPKDDLHLEYWLWLGFVFSKNGDEIDFILQVSESTGAKLNIPPLPENQLKSAWKGPGVKLPGIIIRPDEPDKTGYSAREVKKKIEHYVNEFQKLK